MSFSALALIPAAFLAGLLMFLAPCTLPLVPGYLAFIAGGQRNRVVRNAVAFVFGFSLIFILLGISAGFLGSIVSPWHAYIARFAGIIFIFFGLVMLQVHIPFLSQTRTFRLPAIFSPGSILSSFLMGVLFALGWSPCIGPILGTILLVSSISASALSGTILLFVFSLGLSLPFILSAVFIDRIGMFFTRWAPFTSFLSVCGGIVLLLIGTLMLIGDMSLLVEWGNSLLGFLGYDRLLYYL
jgi:cytochrome c-type biogenesis protein